MPRERQQPLIAPRQACKHLDTADGGELAAQVGCGIGVVFDLFAAVHTVDPTILDFDEQIVVFGAVELIFHENHDRIGQQVAQLVAGMCAGLGVMAGQNSVHDQDIGPLDPRTRERNPLLHICRQICPVEARVGIVDQRAEPGAQAVFFDDMGDDLDHLVP